MLPAEHCTYVFDILTFWIQKTKEIQKKNFENVTPKIRQVIKKSILIHFQKFISSFLLLLTKFFTLDFKILAFSWSYIILYYERPHKWKWIFFSIINISLWVFNTKKFGVLRESRLWTSSLGQTNENLT